LLDGTKCQPLCSPFFTKNGDFLCRFGRHLTVLVDFLHQKCTIFGVFLRGWGFAQTCGIRGLQGLKSVEKNQGF
jgi:hypothetical protein